MTTKPCAARLGEGTQVFLSRSPVESTAIVLAQLKRQEQPSQWQEPQSMGLLIRPQQQKRCVRSFKSAVNWRAGDWRICQSSHSRFTKGDINENERTSQLHDKNAQESLNPPLMPFLEMLNGLDSLTTIRDRQLNGFVQQVVSSGAAPIWMREFKGVVKAVWFNILPVGWVGDWHPSPSLQWVVPLSGRWYTKTQDGIRTEMGPGDIHWGADLGSEAIPLAKGHVSGQVGASPCVQLMIQFESVVDPEVTIVKHG